VLENVEGTSL